jgi:hypothetical protein
MTMDNFLSKKTFSVLAAALGLFCAMPAVHAAAVTYNFTIIGDVQLGDETDPNDYNLSAGDTITATGTFTADLGTIGNETGTVLFSVSGNTMTIDLNGTLLYETDHDTGSGPSLTFNSGSLFDFYYNKTTSSPIFYSSFLFFDDTDLMVGEWRSDVTLTPVPVPAAVWLFGSGLLGLAGIARSKKLKK